MLIRILFLMVLSFNVLADIHPDAIVQAGWSSLPPDKQAEILKAVTDSSKQAADAAAKAASTETKETIDKVVDAVADPATYDKAMDIGDKFVSILEKLANAANTSINDFVKSPVGTITAVVIVYHFMGAAVFKLLMHIFGSIVCFYVGIYGLRTLKQYAYPDKIIYDETKTTFFGNHPIKEIIKRPVTGDFFGVLVFGYVFVGISTVLIFVSGG